MAEDAKVQDVVEDEMTDEEVAEMLDQVAELDESLSPEYTDDLEAAFADEEYEWQIPTGRFNDEGRPIYLNVVVEDPRKTELPTQYIQAMQKGEDKATELLWKTCVKRPVALKNPEVQKKTSSAFKASLTYRLLGLVGVNGDFFSALAAMGSRTGSRPVRKSSTNAHTSIPETPTKSRTGGPSASSPPTDSPTSEESKTGSTSSTILGSSSQKPSEVKRPHLSNTH